MQTLTAILQGLNRVSIPVKNLAIGGLFKVVTTYILVGIPEMNIKGAAIGTVVCYGVAALLDLAAVIRYSKVRMKLIDHLVKPIIATVAMALSVFISYEFLEGMVGGNKASLLSIIVGIVVYAVMLLVIGAINRNDFEMLPGGKRLGRILTRLKLMRD